MPQPQNTTRIVTKSSNTKSHLSRSSGGAASPLLVYTRISQRKDIESILLYPASVKVLRPNSGFGKNNIPPQRTEITGFSESSRRRLSFLANNPSVPLISQFGLSYHKNTPDGRTAKQHINSWLTRIRTRFPEIHYLWIAEFQSRGTIHFHVFLNLPHDLPGLRNILATTWHKIAEPDSPEHLEVHKHKKNFIKWEMKSSGYLTKYLDKAAQKCIPEGFMGMGRFWGNSRDLLAIPETITPADLAHLVPETINAETGETTGGDAFSTVIRTLGKLHEKQIKRWQQRTNKKLWKSRVRKGVTSCTLQTSAPQLRQILSYLRKQFIDESGLPF